MLMTIFILIESLCPSHIKTISNPSYLFSSKKEMMFGSLIQTHLEVKLHFTSLYFTKRTALTQFKNKDSFTTIKVVIETLIKN